VKPLILALALLVAPATVLSQTTRPSDVAQRLQQLEDRAALKALVDTFSVLADRKDVATQVLLFTEDATVESRTGGQPGTPFRGRKQIGDAFSAFLATFETVYHINGQQTVTITGNRATGVAYCLVTLIGNENGKRIKTTMGVIYNDEYVRQGGRWLIAKRTSNFTWRERTEMAQP
jgi:ketosteroid isomerase-like protein